MPSSPARVFLVTQRTIGEISPLLFGGFAEHLGRCIYGGIYDPASAHADDRGLRRDVVDAIRELGVRLIRYPGGNFLSGYHWLDGVGPKAQRPRRRELAWQSVESNQFGTNEFLELCRTLGAEPMLGVNLGTGTLEEAAALVEYCNAPAGTACADLRVSHGYPAPHGVIYWCLGNEMDGPWQIGGLDMHAYAQKAREAAKLMKWQDPSIKLVLCGSSNPAIPTYPEWDRVVLEACWDHVEFLSLHHYAGNREDDTASYLASTVLFEEHVDTLAATLRYVQTRLRSRHEVRLAWDEWNVWYKDRTMQGGWAEAPSLLEEIYNLEDALVVAQWLSVFLRRCNLLKIACLAQIVNVIAPILTRPDGLLRQTIFYPFMLFSRHARGFALDPVVQSPTYPTKRFGDVPAIDASASHDPATGATAVFLVNRGVTDTQPVEVVWRGQAPASADAIWQLAGTGPKATNTFARPDAVTTHRLPGVPQTGGILRIDLPPISFTTLTGTMT